MKDYQRVSRPVKLDSGQGRGWPADYEVRPWPAWWTGCRRALARMQLATLPPLDLPRQTRKAVHVLPDPALSSGGRANQGSDSDQAGQPVVRELRAETEGRGQIHGSELLQPAGHIPRRPGRRIDPTEESQLVVLPSAYDEQGASRGRAVLQALDDDVLLVLVEIRDDDAHLRPLVPTSIEQGRQEHGHGQCRDDLHPCERDLDGVAVGELAYLRKQLSAQLLAPVMAEDNGPSVCMIKNVEAHGSLALRNAWVGGSRAAGLPSQTSFAPPRHEPRRLSGCIH